jgi:hypothetical protein
MNVYYNKGYLIYAKGGNQMMNSGRKIAIITGILVFVFCGCSSKPAPAPQAPEDFVALLDYRQLPSGKAYGTVFVIPNKYQGSVALSAQGKTEKISVKPGQRQEFGTAVELTVGDILEVKAGDRTQKIKIKYAGPQRVSLGFVDTPARMFNDKTPFYATKSKKNYISTYHIAKTSAASLGFPGPDTLWFAVAFKNRITIKDAGPGMIIVKAKDIPDRKIYYVTSYFYDMDYNYLGGSTGWEAKYVKD